MQSLLGRPFHPVSSTLTAFARLSPHNDLLASACSLGRYHWKADNASQVTLNQFTLKENPSYHVIQPCLKQKEGTKRERGVGIE